MKAMMIVHVLQDELVEHVDDHTPSSLTNESLGDIIREMTKIRTDHGYIQSKIDKIIFDTNALDDSFFSYLRKASRGYNYDNFDTQSIKEILTNYIKANSRFIEIVKELDDLPEDRKKIILEIARAQIGLSRYILKDWRNENARPLLVKKLRRVVKHVEQYISPK